MSCGPSAFAEASADRRSLGGGWSGPPDTAGLPPSRLWRFGEPRRSSRVGHASGGGKACTTAISSHAVLPKFPDLHRYRKGLANYRREYNWRIHLGNGVVLTVRSLRSPPT